MTHVAIIKALITQASVAVEFLLVCWRWMGMQFVGALSEVQEVVIFIAFFFSLLYLRSKGFRDWVSEWVRRVKK